MKLLQFAASSIVGASTGSHLTQTSYRTSYVEDTQYQTRQTRNSILQIIRNKVASVSRLASRLAAANKQRLQRNKDTVQILQLNAHYLEDIGLTYDDQADLKSGQRSLKVASVSRLLNRLTTAYRKRLQRNKATVQILQLNAHHLKDIGLTNDDLADLKSGQISLDELNTVRSESQGSFNLRLKKAGTSKIGATNLKAANQELGELASCG